MTRNRWYDAAAGVLAAAVALGVTELMAGLTGSSLIIGVGNAVIDFTPGAIVKPAIEALGHHDKPTILWSVVVVSLLLGGVLGPTAARRRWVGGAAFVAFALVGALAAARDPLTSTTIAFVDAALAGLAGWIALQLLLGAVPEPPAEWELARGDEAMMPGRGIAGRRRFLAFAAGASGATALTAVVGRNLGITTADVEAERRAIVLPTVRSGPVGAPVAGAPVAAATTTPAPTAEPTAESTRVPAPEQANGALQVDGLSPLVTPNGDFYRIDTALVVPRVSTSGWTLSITGMVDHPYTLSFHDLLSMASVETSATLVCVSNDVGGSLAGNAVWLGVSLPAILKKAGVQPGATQVVGRSVDGFTVGFPTEVALDGRPAMVAIGMNGQPLPAQHGFPARLIVPGLYGYVSATKWLKEIELTTLDAFDAYWVPRGWSKLAPIKTQSRVDVPRNGSTVKAGRVPVAGVAWGGIRGVSRVEVRIEPQGASANTAAWREARLSEELSQSSWRQWVVEWDATPGTYLIEARATDGQGNTQTATRQPPAPNGATGYPQARVTVANA